MDKVARSSLRRATIFGIVFSGIFIFLAVASLIDLLRLDGPVDSGIIEKIIGYKLNGSDTFWLFMIALIGLSLTVAAIFFGKRLMDRTED